MIADSALNQALQQSVGQDRVNLAAAAGNGSYFKLTGEMFELILTSTTKNGSKFLTNFSQPVQLIVPVSVERQAEAAADNLLISRYNEATRM
ncbi:MAG: hypothetical protein AAGU27_10125 [Dehalobacterium sp.]